jgi:hypothetical protein
MDKRQKLILGALAVVVAFAASEHIPGLLDGGGQSAADLQRASRDAEAVAQSLRSALGDAEIGRDVDRMMTLVAREWASNPIYVWPPSVETAADTVESDPGSDMEFTVVYGGFIQLAGQRFAILNNVEYAVGELIEGVALRVRDIQPRHVVLESSVDGEQYTILYDDIVFFE